MARNDKAPPSNRRLPRRHFLRGAAGITFGLPVLEAFRGRRALAQSQSVTPPFVIFMRQANGISQGRDDEPDRFWPTRTGALTEATMVNRAVGELSGYRNQLLLTKVRNQSYNYGDGHARGVLQCLTAHGPYRENQGGDSEANGASIDFVIGQHLNPDNRDALYLMSGSNSGWVGGACISFRGPNQRRSALRNPWFAYESFASGNGALSNEAQRALRAKGNSLNDLVRGQLQALKQSSQLSSRDIQTLDLHQSTIRDLEVSLTCALEENEARALEDEASIFDSSNGNDRLATARLHLEVAALSVACGVQRSVALQIGAGNDPTRYQNLSSGGLMENFHYLSHRRLSHGGSGPSISNGDLLHHYVDVQFARTFRHLLDTLDRYPDPNGGSLLDAGMAVWFADLGDGPSHSTSNLPYIIAGSAGQQLKQGEYIELTSNNRRWHRRLLQSIGVAAGLSETQANAIGDPDSSGGVIEDLFV